MSFSIQVESLKMGNVWTNYFRPTQEELGDIGKYLKTLGIQHHFDEKAMAYFSKCVRDTMTFTKGINDEPVELAAAHNNSDYPHRFRVGLIGYNLSLESNDQSFPVDGFVTSVPELRDMMLTAYRMCGGKKTETYDGIVDLDIFERNLPEGLRFKRMVSRSLRITSNVQSIGHTPRAHEISDTGPNAIRTMATFGRESSEQIYNLVYMRRGETYVLNKPGKKEKT